MGELRSGSGARSDLVAVMKAPENRMRSYAAWPRGAKGSANGLAGCVRTPLAEALMRPSVEVGAELVEELLQLVFTVDENVVQAFASDGSDKPSK
jgi:hypothetical protein